MVIFQRIVTRLQKNWSFEVTTGWVLAARTISISGILPRTFYPTTCENKSLTKTSPDSQHRLFNSLLLAFKLFFKLFIYQSWFVSVELKYFTVVCHPRNTVYRCTLTFLHRGRVTQSISTINSSPTLRLPTLIPSDHPVEGNSTR